MTREECEKEISKHILDILRIAKEYNPNFTYLSSAIIKIKEGYDVVCNNRFWDIDNDYPINFENYIPENSTKDAEELRIVLLKCSNEMVSLIGDLFEKEE